MTGNERLEDLLEIDAPAGFASVLCEPPGKGHMFPDVSDPLAAALAVTVLASALGLLLVVIACIRIAASDTGVTGYRFCLGTVGRVIAANADWLILFVVYA